MSAPASGYSGKPLAQKLGLKPGLRVLVLDAPHDYAALTGFDLGLVQVLPRVSAFDFAHAFVRSRAGLDTLLKRLDRHLAGDAVLWVSWPKKSSGIACDVTEDTVRELALPRGLVDIKVCAVDATWSGLKLVRRKALR
jgi:hypothetical protein